MRILSMGAVVLAVTALSATVAFAQSPSKAQLREAANEAAIRQANEAAKVKEHQVIQRLRGIEALLANEQKLLERRLAYAAQIRAKGLQDEDDRLLRQAEEIERQAVALYEQRISQLEKQHLQIEAEQAGAGNAPQGKAVESVPETSGPEARQSSDTSPRRAWWPFGR